MKRIIDNPILNKLKNPFGIIGLILSFILVIFIIIGFFWTPYDPDAMSATLRFAKPCISHPFGCDNMGRDILSRVMKGSLVTLFVGFSTVFIGLLFGIIIGAISGYYGGRIDNFLMKINDSILAFPSVLLALIFISIFGAGKDKLIITLGIIFIPTFTRMVRAEILKLKGKDFVNMAKLIKTSDFRIIFIHILPNAVPVIISTAAIGFNNAILAEASLSFIGMGVRPGESSIGKMLSESQSYIATAPWYSLFTGGFMVLLILSFGMISEGISRGKRATKNRKFKY